MAALDAEIYDPDPAPGSGPGSWLTAARSRVPRLYHSVALLMPDGKVITAGSNPERRVEERRIGVFWPPYLFAGERPGCGVARAEWPHGAALVADVPDAAAITSACLIRPGATTHSGDNEQRLIDLPIEARDAGRLTVRLPGGTDLAPPGWYLLFVVNGLGVPSPGAWVRLTGGVA